jgi:L-threonylcarbamoyladenylate synthase
VLSDKPKYHTITGLDVDHAAALLRSGKTVGIPTETVYGLAANALNEEAVLKIYETKNRPQFNPLIIHVSSYKEAQKWVKKMPDKAEKLALRFWPGPLTLLLEKKDIVPDLVTAGHSRLAIRVPNHPLTLELLKRLDFPLAAPSANPSGYVSPTRAAHVYAGLQGKIPYILDGGDCTVGLESTIVGWNEKEETVIYRHGGISREVIEQVLGEKIASAPSLTDNPAAPGMLKSHYATTTPLHAGRMDDLLPQWIQQQPVLIMYHQYYPNYPTELQYVLTPQNDLHEAARNLFKILREADQQKAAVILAEYAPSLGLGLAINDRIERAKYEWKKEI